jgi:hypothetical protein
MDAGRAHAEGAQAGTGSVQGCRVDANVLAVGSAAGTFGPAVSRGALPMMRAAGNGHRGATSPLSNFPNLPFQAHGKAGMRWEPMRERKGQGA